MPEYWVCSHPDRLHDSPGLPGAYAEALLPQPTHADTWTQEQSYCCILYCSHNYQHKLFWDKIAQKQYTCWANNLLCTLHKLSCSTQFNILFIKLFSNNISSPEVIWYWMKCEDYEWWMQYVRTKLWHIGWTILTMTLSLRECKTQWTNRPGCLIIWLGFETDTL